MHDELATASHPADAHNFDVVVIGSGFGGSVAANRLALAGQRVLVLERGPWRDSLPVRSMGVVRRSPFPYGTKAFTHLLHSLHRGRLSLHLNKAGMYEFCSFPGLNVLVASAVGGGSTAYGGLLEAPRNPTFWHNRHPNLDPTAIERYYEKVIADMGGVRLSRAHLLPQSVWTHFPADAGRRCQAADPQPHMALLIPPAADAAGQSIEFGPASVQRKYCSFDGDSFLGSPGGAKASVDFVYLAPVLNKGVTVRDLCRVNRIQPSCSADGPGYVVNFTDLATRTDAVLRVRRVVLAAGTLNTQRLLFKSVLQSGGLTPMPSLGRTFGGNGDLTGVWLKKSISPSSFTSPPSQGALTVSGYESIAYGMGGFPGVETLPIPAFVKRRLARSLFLYGIGADSGKASVTFKSGHLQLDYDHHREPVFDDVRGGFRVLEAESATKIWTSGKPLSVHPWGGACVGPNVDRGVIDHRGEIYGNPGLFVADSAALPAAPGGPPSLAIAAWAHHVADGMLPA